MASRRFINIKTFKHGATAYTTIQSLSYNQDTQEIAASGDADRVDTFLAKGKESTRGDLALQDPIQAEALRQAGKADITFQGEPESGGVATNITIKNVIFFGNRGQTMHNGVWAQSLTWRAYDPTGGAVVVFADPA
jgi:hypothetical protein